MEKGYKEFVTRIVQLLETDDIINIINPSVLLQFFLLSERNCFPLILDTLASIKTNVSIIKLMFVILELKSVDAFGPIIFAKSISSSKLLYNVLVEAHAFGV